MTTTALRVLRALLSTTIVIASGTGPAVASPAPVPGSLLPVPGGQPTVTAVAVAAGRVTVDGVTRAVRWSVSGLSSN